MFRFLASEVGAFLPEYAVVTIWHLRDLAAGKRLLILAKDAQHFFVPQFEDLDKQDMLDFGAGYPKVMEALPLVEHERAKLHRSYLANVIYTLVGDPFRKWVNNVMELRNRKIQQE